MPHWKPPLKIGGGSKDKQNYLVNYSQKLLNFFFCFMAIRTYNQWLKEGLATILGWADIPRVAQWEDRRCPIPIWCEFSTGRHFNERKIKPLCLSHYNFKAAIIFNLTILTNITCIMYFSVQILVVVIWGKMYGYLLWTDKWPSNGIHVLMSEICECYLMW